MARSRRTPGILLWGLALTVVMVLGRLPLLGTDDVDFLYYATVSTAIVWILAFFLFAGVSATAGVSLGLDQRILGVGVAIGLFAFVLHDMINFAMFVPAGATTAFALLAVGVSTRLNDEGSGSATIARLRWPAVAGAVGLTAALAVFIVLPAIRANAELLRARSARHLVSPDTLADQPAFASYKAAVAADGLDPTPPSEFAHWLIAASSIPRLSGEALPLAGELLAQAVDRDPYNVAHRRRQVMLYRVWAESGGGHLRSLDAVKAAHLALDLYPQDPAGLVTLADCQSAAGRSGRSPDLLAEAIANYERALALDDDRLEWETIKRFRDWEREAIREKIGRTADYLSELRR